MRNQTYLLKRGSIYYCRIPVPKADQQRLGRKEIWKSLGVSCYGEAKERLRAHLYNLSHSLIMDILEKPEQLTLQAIPTILNISYEEIIVEFMDVLEKAVLAWDNPELREQLKQEFVTKKEQLLSKISLNTESNYSNVVAGYGTELLNRNQISFKPGSSELGLLFLQLQPALKRQLEIIIDKANSHSVLSGNIVYRNATPEYARKIARYRSNPNRVRAMLQESLAHDMEMLGQLNGHTPLETLNRTAAAKSANMSFGKLLETYSADAENQNLTLRQGQFHQTCRRIFSNLVPTDTDISKIDRQFLKKIIAQLKQLPKKANTKREFDGLNTLQVIEKAQSLEDVEFLSNATINNYLDYLIRLLKYAEREGYLKQMPNIQKLSLEDTVHAKEKRDPFTVNQLNLIFSAPELLENKLSSKAHKFWIPVISYLTGMRAGEITQLTVDDIKKEGDIHYIDINTANGTKSVKNESSIRQVPVFKLLEKVGFLKYVQLRRDSNDKSLFPNLTVNPSKASDAFSKQFGHFKRRLGITSTKAVFHSFRHNFEDADRNTAGINHDAIRVLCGWSGQGVHNNYGSGYSLKTLKENIDLIDLGSVNLSDLFES